jgi:hypothetical protein
LIRACFYLGRLRGARSAGDGSVVPMVGRWRRVVAAVKAGRRPPPEAARSGLDGGEPGARLCDRDVSVRIVSGQTSFPELGREAGCDNHRINLYPVGCGDPAPDLSCTGEGKTQKRRDPSTKAESEDPSPVSVTRLSWITLAVIDAPSLIRGSGASRRRWGRGRFPDSARAPPSACGPAPRWRSCGCGP